MTIYEHCMAWDTFNTKNSISIFFCFVWSIIRLYHSPGLYTLSLCIVFSPRPISMALHHALFLQHHALFLWHHALFLWHIAPFLWHHALVLTWCLFSMHLTLFLTEGNEKQKFWSWNAEKHISWHRYFKNFRGNPSLVFWCALFNGNRHALFHSGENTSVCVYVCVKYLL